MRTLARMSFLLVSLLTLLQSSAKCDDPPDGGGTITLAPVNGVSFDKMSPTTPAVGKVEATGTVTTAKGWTCTKVELKVVDQAGNQVDTAMGQPNAQGAWSYSQTGFTSKTNVTITVTATFTKGTMTDTKMATAGLTVR